MSVYVCGGGEGGGGLVLVVLWWCGVCLSTDINSTLGLFCIGHGLGNIRLKQTYKRCESMNLLCTQF